jgi:Holliday junction resolvasome RuvABC endonuclease subunit
MSGQRVLTLDMSMTRTGWAFQRPAKDGGIKVYTGAISFPVTDKAFPHRRYSVFAAFIVAAIKELRPDVIVFEENTARRAGAEALIFLKMRLLEICAKHRIPTKSIYPATLKKHFTGNDKADKPQMMAVAAERFAEYDPTNDEGADIADALALLHWWRDGCPPSQASVDKAKKREAIKAAKKATKTKEASTR